MAEKHEFRLDDGTVGSRSAYIRQEFLKGRSRGDIAKELGVAYGIVYTATANMDNGTAGGRSQYTVDGKPRAEWIREQLKAGKTRGQIAKELGISYASVYAVTRGLVESDGDRHGKVLLEDGRPRVEVIREMYAQGMTRREIANALHCDYAVVWAATKPKKEDEDEAEVEVPVEASDTEDELAVEFNVPEDDE